MKPKPPPDTSWLRTTEITERPRFPRWWWAFAAVGVVFWGAVIYVAAHFIGKWW